jgi:transcription termination/antitermination protein NusG
MSDLQQTARQTKALAKKRKASRAARKRRMARIKSANRTALPTPARVRARKKTERFEVGELHDWAVVRSDPARAARCAARLREVGLPVFEARQEERLVDEDRGKARIAQVPVLRRLMFVGIPTDPHGAGHLGEDLRDSLRALTGLREVWCEGEEARVWIDREWLAAETRPLRVSAHLMQRFADHITGHRQDDQAVDEVMQMLFGVGDMVRATEGPFALFSGKVEEVDPRKGRVKVGLNVMGGTIPAWIDQTKLEAA